MACTENDAYAERMRIMSLHGISKDAWKRFTADGSWYYEIVAPGFKYNLTDIAAAMGLHQIRKANRLHQQRTERALLYTSGLKDVDELILPQHGLIGFTHGICHPRGSSWISLKIDRAQFIELGNEASARGWHWMPTMHPYYRETHGYLRNLNNCSISGIISLNLPTRRRNGGVCV
jgi:perosamine synthetase